MYQEIRMPVIFAGHGSPMNAIDDTLARQSWRKLRTQMGRPRAIVCISAHWATHGTKVRTAANNPQINDMYGFPQELYEVSYQPENDPQIAQRPLELLGDLAQEDNSWGIDHGAWSVLCNMFPQADVPVTLISVDMDSSGEQLLEIGRRLAPLRREGVLILCSGNIVHNLAIMDPRVDGAYPWAEEFDKIILRSVLNQDSQTPSHFTDLANWQKAIASAEHYYPFLIAMGATDHKDIVKVFNHYYEMGSISMTSYAWGM